MANKRYYYLKISSDFFDDKPIKRLRRLPGGDTYTIVYLKMLLSSLETDGYLVYENVEDNPIEEIALDIDEDVETVEITMNYLVKKGLASCINENIELTRVHELSGSETDSARRMRKLRLSQCDTDLSQIGSGVTQLLANVQKRDVIQETETELETDIDTETDKKTEYGQSVSQSSCDNIPTLDELKAYIEEKKLKVDAKQFYECYESLDWKIDGQPIKNWKAVCRGWNNKRPIVSVVLDEKFYEKKEQKSDEEIRADTARLQEMLKEKRL